MGGHTGLIPRTESPLHLLAVPGWAQGAREGAREGRKPGSSSTDDQHFGLIAEGAREGKRTQGASLVPAWLRARNLQEQDGKFPCPKPKPSTSAAASSSWCCKDLAGMSPAAPYTIWVLSGHFTGAQVGPEWQKAHSEWSPECGPGRGRKPPVGNDCNSELKWKQKDTPIQTYDS